MPSNPCEREQQKSSWPQPPWKMPHRHTTSCRESWMSERPSSMTVNHGASMRSVDLSSKVSYRHVRGAKPRVAARDAFDELVELLSRLAQRRKNLDETEAMLTRAAQRERAAAGSQCAIADRTIIHSACCRGAGIGCRGSIVGSSPPVERSRPLTTSFTSPTYQSTSVLAGAGSSAIDPRVAGYRRRRSRSCDVSDR